MGKMIITGRIFFAIAIIAFGILNFIFGDFMMARSLPVVPDTAGRLIAVYFSGFVLLISGVLILLQKKAAPAAFFTAIIIFSWALMRNVPQALSDSVFGGLWTNTFKAFAIGGGALIIMAYYPTKNFTIGILSIREAQMANLIWIGRFLVSAFLLVCGVQHFIFIDFVAGYIPAYIPSHYFWAYFTGTALIAGGLGLMIRGTQWMASILGAVMIFLWVLLLHIPLAVMKSSEPASWTGVFEALSISGILFILAGTTKNKSAYGFSNQAGQGKHSQSLFETLQE